MPLSPGGHVSQACPEDVPCPAEAPPLGWPFPMASP